MTIDTQNERAIPEELSFPAMRVADIYAPREPEGTVSGKWYHSWYVSGVKKDTIAETEHSGTRFIHLNTTCYTLPFAFESRSVLLGLMDQTHYFYEQAQELETNLMDEVWVAKSSRESDSSYLFAHSGRYVFEIYYANGTRDITELLPLLADKLNG